MPKPENPENPFCPRCSSRMKRNGYSKSKTHTLLRFRCPKCGKSISVKRGIKYA